MLTTALGGCGTRGSAPAGTALPAPPDPGLDDGMVHTTAGRVRGEIGQGYRLFQGIPYAAAPIGPLRWQPPRPAEPWPGIREASRPGKRCIQDVRLDPGGGHGDSEDCLFVNVWSPAGAVARPVLVWIHGGGFANGSGAMYDARRLTTEGDVVVVTLNYRLGALGFLIHPALGEGNYGLADQQAALRWVRANIAGFGGDPDRVTIAGESAGAMSVCDHLAAPDSAGLFRSAVIASGPCRAQADRATAERVGRDYVAAAGCARGRDEEIAGCLRAIAATDLEESPWYTRLGDEPLTGPVLGTPVLPVDPVTAMGGPDAVSVPVLIGTTADEFTLFPALQYLRTGAGLPTAADYPGLLAQAFGRHGAAVAARYPLPAGATPAQVTERYARTVTDGAFACPATRMAAALAGAAPVYFYEFDDPAAPRPEPLTRVPFRVGASHSLDLRYLFDIVGAPALSAAQRRLSAQMIGYWSAFVTTGVPAVPGAPSWPAVADATGAGPVLSLRTDGSRPISDYAAEHRCEFWAGLGS
ncbi:MAG TPA: carboxylesterase family protein [Mycobacterium sp.]|nr:carboxylesterase family protein [Mycobacterium sp.]